MAEYSDQDCIDALREAAEAYGDQITSAEYRESGQRPSTRTLSERFGSWNEAKEAAGLTVTPHGGTRQFRPPSCQLNKPDGHLVVRTQIGDKRYAVKVHRLIAVAEFGFDSLNNKVVHHKNHIPWDNRPDNLELMDRAAHSRHHVANQDDPKFQEV